MHSGHVAPGGEDVISTSPRSFLLCKLHHPTRFNIHLTLFPHLRLNIHPTHFPLLPRGRLPFTLVLARILNSKTSSYTTLSHIDVIADRMLFQFTRFMGYAMIFMRSFLLSSISIRHYVEGLRQSSPPEWLYATRSISGAEEVSLWSQHSWLVTCSPADFMTRSMWNQAIGWVTIYATDYLRTNQILSSIVISECQASTLSKRIDWRVIGIHLSNCMWIFQGTFCLIPFTKLALKRCFRRYTADLWSVFEFQPARSEKIKGWRWVGNLQARKLVSYNLFW